MKHLNPSLVLGLYFFTLVGCSGGGGGGGSGGSGAAPPSDSVTVSASAYQDKKFTIDLSSFSSSVSSVTFQNGPSWLTFDSVTKKIEGVPNDNVNINNLSFTVTRSDGSSSTFGPYSISVNGDPLRKYQWHIQNTGQTNFATNPGVAGNDINQTQTIQNGITGSGVKVAVSDSGVEIAHEDLSANIIAGASKNYNLSSPYIGDPTPTSTTDGSVGHGTAVAGIIGAVGWNNIGTRGVAPNSKIAGLRFIGSSQSTAILIDQANGSFDIFNYSYGGPSLVPKVEDTAYLAQLRYGTTSQRGGKGSFYVKSAGNEFTSDYSYDSTGGPLNCFNTGSGINGNCHYFGNSNFGSAENSSTDIIVVGAINSQGTRSSYSTPGSNLWVSAPGGEFGDTDPAIMTTDIQGCNKGMSSTLETPVNSFENSSSLNPSCKYTSKMNGTSSAAPVTSGVIALILEANPILSWRDVKYILASTATKTDSTATSTSHPSSGLNLTGYTYQQGWTQNAAGFWFHNWYGFGRVNADNAVTLAKSYVGTLNPLRATQASDGTWQYSSGTISQAIPDNSATGTSSSINIRHNFIIEGIQVKFTTSHQWITDLGIELTSPSGTKNILMNINSGAFFNPSLTYTAQLLSNAFYGESSRGNWTLKVVDGAAGDTGALTSWQINVIGHNNPTPSDTTPPSPPSGLSLAQFYNSLIAAPTATFTASPSGDVMRYEYAIGVSSGGATVKEWTPIGLSTSITAASLSLTNGSTYYLSVRAIDTSENISTTISSAWTVDTTAPTATIANLANLETTNSTSITLTGTCEASSTVNIGVVSGISITSATCDAAGVLTIVYTITGSTGKKTVNLTLTDRAGNLGSNFQHNMIYIDPFKEILSIGDHHACAITSGAVKCWGQNDYGQLGDNTTTDRNSPVSVSGLSSVLSVASGSRHSCAIKSDGTAWCWGYNITGALGNSVNTNSSVPVQVTGISAATQISSGFDFSCALLSNSTVKCWGYNAMGSLGNSTNVDSNIPVLVSGISIATKISSARGAHTCALLSTGGVKCWGWNSNGQLGNNSTTDSNLPVSVSGIASGASDIQVSSYGSCAQVSAQTKCWGWNNYFQLANGSSSDSITPSVVSSVSGYKMYSLGDVVSCVISSAGKPQCWGSPAYGLLGDTNLTNSTSTPTDLPGLTQNVAIIKSGFSFSCAVKTDGSINCWGKRSEGELGNNVAGGDGSKVTTKYTSLSSNISTVVSGRAHACIVKSDTTVWCSGSDGSGQLGLSNGNNFYSNDLGYDKFRQINSLTGIVAQISAGSNHTCVRTTTGGVKCWGLNSSGQLGDGTTNSSSTPVDVAGLGGAVIDLAAGAYHTCALITGGTIKCWGANNYGQLGNSSTSSTAVTSPQLVTGITNGKSITAGRFHTCTQYMASAVACWGRNANGQLGINSTTDSSSPVALSIVSVTSLSAGARHTCALQSTGSLWCWGLNSNGQLGNNDATLADKLTPQQVTGITSGALQVSSGMYHTCSLMSGGAVNCWGSNFYGQVGVGTVGVSYITYSAVSGLNSSIDISSGESYTCSVTNTGSLQCWGQRTFGQFGDGVASTGAPSVVSGGLTLF